MALQQQLIRVGDIDMHCWSDGHGTPVTFLHAVGMDGRNWAVQAEALAGRFRVILPDLRGHGATSRGTAAYTLDTLGEDIIRLWDALGIAASHLVGLSMGGMVAQGIALRAPERVRSLVLVSTAGTFAPSEREVMRGRARAVTEGGMAGILDATIRRWFNPGLIAAQAPAVLQTRETLLAADPAVHAECWGAISALDYLPRLGEIRCPTLVLVGDADASTPVRFAEGLARAIPGASLRIVPGGPHMLPVEAPAPVTEALSEFLR